MKWRLHGAWHAGWIPWAGLSGTQPVNMFGHCAGGDRAAGVEDRGRAEGRVGVPASGQGCMAEGEAAALTPMLRAHEGGFDPVVAAIGAM